MEPYSIADHILMEKGFDDDDDDDDDLQYFFFH